MRLSRSAAALLGLCVFAVFPSRLGASTIIYRTNAELVALSDRVVHGRVVAVRTESAENGAIFTVATLAVLEDFTGGTDATVEVWELGGIHNGRFLYVGGGVQFEVGAELVLCLEQGPRGLRTVAMNFSKFEVVPFAGADALLERSLAGTEVLGGTADRPVNPTLSEFRALTERIKQTRTSRFDQNTALDLATSSTQPYTFLTFGNGLGVRWVQADSGVAVNWYKNLSAAPPIPGDAVNEIQTALSAWTAPSSASVILQYAGTTTQANAKGPWSGIGEGNGVITFEDPGNEISGSVLAIGGGSGYYGGGGTVNGVSFNKFATGYVIFQNAANLSSSFKQSTNFTRVLEHEIGHAIGLGHTQSDGSVANATSNIMYPACCYAETPIAPNLGPDDLAGLNFIYPATSPPPPPPPCTFSLSQSAANFSSGAASATLTISASASTCAWTAVSNASFLSVSPGSGTGTSLVGYNVAANTSTSTRSGTLTIGGQTFTVTQDGVTITRRPPVDFNGDGMSDVGVFRPDGGTWFIQGLAAANWGSAGDLPVPGDYLGDGTADIGVFRPSTGTWYIVGGPTLVWGMAGDVPVPADYNGDRITDIAVFRPRTGEWLIHNVGTFAFGAAGDLPVVGDYNGDGTADIAVWRPATGVWYVRNLSTTVWGNAGDVPVPADYNGDGTTDIAVWRPANATWYVKDQFTRTFGALGDVPVPLERSGDGYAELGVFRGSANTFHFFNTLTSSIDTVAWGAAGDVPLGRSLPAVGSIGGDFDGDRKADVTVYRPSTGDWISLRSLSNNADYTITTWGLSTDTPVGRDYDGDGKIDPAVFRPSNGTWYVRRSSTAFDDYVAQFWGLSEDIPVPADYDGDRRADFAVFRPSTGQWVILLSTTGNTSYVRHDFGLSGDIPAAADYDGDGRADVAVFRPSTGRWYILNRFNGTYSSYEWGLTGDVPVAGDYDGDGRADVAVFRPSTGRWYIRWVDGSHNAYDFGLNGDTPVTGDYDGDGRADIAVFRPSTGRWYVLDRFAGTYTYRDWGLVGDRAVVR